MVLGEIVEGKGFRDRIIIEIVVAGMVGIEGLYIELYDSY